VRRPARYASEIEVSRGRWTWVRLDSASLASVDLGRVTLRDPQDLAELLDGSYWQTKVVGGQANITCDLLNLYLDDGTAIAEWQAEFDDTAQQVRKRMREVALLTFNGSLIDSLREYWASEVVELSQATLPRGGQSVTPGSTNGG
jgi:hypothetical protein